MEALNTAIRSAIPHMTRVAEENPNADVMVRAISFASGANWHIQDPTHIDDFQWKDLSPSGITDMGKAFDLLSEELRMPPMDERALPPVLVLVTDGQPTDDYKKSLDAMMKLPWGKKAVRLGIAIGRAANERVLKEFIDNDEIKVLRADNAEELVEYIKWVSTVVLKAASSPASQTEDLADTSANVIIPDIPNDFWDDEDISVEDVW